MPSQGPSHRKPSRVRQLVAANIDRGIRERDMTNRAVGDAIGSTEHQVWRWRAGKVMPGDENLTALANVLFDGDVAEMYSEQPAAA